jgi:guanine deaminase
MKNKKIAKEKVLNPPLVTCHFSPCTKYMHLAVREAAKNLKEMKGGPFGACVVKDDRILAIARNTVLINDATCHAEVNAIRIASKKLKTYDLSGCVIYSTTEPCPMCFSAIHWSGIDTIVYGASIDDAHRSGFNELSISNKKMKSLGKAKVIIIPHFLSRECQLLFRKWRGLKNCVCY